MCGARRRCASALRCDVHHDVACKEQEKSHLHMRVSRFQKRVVWLIFLFRSYKKHKSTCVGILVSLEKISHNLSRQNKTKTISFGVHYYVYCVQREVSNLIGTWWGEGGQGGGGRVGVGACDSRYIQTPDPYLARLSDKSGRARLRPNVDVCQGLLADQWRRFTVQKLNAPRVGR